MSVGAARPDADALWPQVLRQLHHASSKVSSLKACVGGWGVCGCVIALGLCTLCGVGCCVEWGVQAHLHLEDTLVCSVDVENTHATTACY